VRFIAHPVNKESYITDHSKPVSAGHLLFFYSPSRPARVIGRCDRPCGMPSESRLPVMRHSSRVGSVRGGGGV
jgi:hypothetical protein